MPLKVVPRRDRKLNRLVKAAKVERVRRGDVLCPPGQRPDTVLLVRRGHVRVVEPCPGPGRGERTVAVAGPWELAGEGALLDGNGPTPSLVAGEPVELQRLDAARVAAVLRSSVATFDAFVRALTADLRLARSLAAGSGGPPTASRLAAVLLDLLRRLGEPVAGGDGDAGPARPPGRKEPGGSWRIPVRLTHQTLADLCGAHRSTVTTVLNEWIYDDVLAGGERQVVILRPEGLRALASPPPAAPDGGDPRTSHRTLR